MTSLESLASFVPELSEDQAAAVDGGIIPVLAFVTGAIWGAVVVKWSR